MASVGVLCSLVVLLAVTSSSQGDEPTIAGDNFVYKVMDGNDICFYASFRLTFTINYLGYPNISNTSVVDIMSAEIKLPNKTAVDTTGDCGANETALRLSWKQDDAMFSSVFTFGLNSTWQAKTIAFTFDSTFFHNPVEKGMQSYITNKTNGLFDRTFSIDDYFYCEKCKTFKFGNCTEDTLSTCVNPCPKSGNKTMCSTLDMMTSVLYPGDIIEEHANRKLCIEDYIALQELIVPIVVGGILGILLLLIFVAYIIAYCRRRRKEGRYERLGEATY